MCILKYVKKQNHRKNIFKTNKQRKEIEKIMLNFCSLYSGSSGNSLFVETDNTKLLIDAGVSSKKIEKALNDLDVDPCNLDGILVTHEHSDHVQGLGTFSKKFDLPVFVNQETLDAMPKQRDKIADKNIKKFKVAEKFSIGDLDINPFSIPHDAANPCGFTILNEDKKISIATDIGHMTNDILKNLEESLFVMLESNYDPEVLKCSSYPFSLKSRIAGPSRTFIKSNCWKNHFLFTKIRFKKCHAWSFK